MHLLISVIVAQLQHCMILFTGTMVGVMPPFGKSCIPTMAYPWINFTQVTVDDSPTTTALFPIIYLPKAADINGSDKNVGGEGTLCLDRLSSNLTE